MFHPGELSEAVAIAYEATLKPFHNFVVRGVVSVSDNTQRFFISVIGTLGS